MTRVAAGALALGFLGGCGPDCMLQIAEGSDDNRGGLVHQGDRIVFEARFEGETLTCGGHWLVNHIEGGSPGFGLIDPCGVYQAPAAFPTGIVELQIEAIFPGRAEAVEGCERDGMTLWPVP